MTAADPRRLKHGIANRPGQLVQHRCLHREGVEIGRQRAEYLVPYVFGDQVMLTAELDDDLGTVAQQRGREGEHRRPPLRPTDQRPHPFEVWVDPCAGKERCRLGGGHGELLNANFAQQSMRAQPGERERRLAARGKRHHRPFRQLLEGRFHHIAKDARMEQIRIIQHKHEPFVAPAASPHQRYQRIATIACR